MRNSDKNAEAPKTKKGVFMKRICIVDSGYDAENVHINKEQIEKAVTIQQCGNEIRVIEGAEDKIGHGTAVLSVLQSGDRNSYSILKIFDDLLECNEEVLLYALQYVYDNIECDILNLSLGITSCTQKRQLNDICRKLYDRNTIIVAAFDNSGAVSYPAAFSCVIGVDNDLLCKKRDDLVYVEDSMVNVFAFGKVQRIPWLYPKYMFVSGSSIACAHVTRLLASSEADTTDKAISFLYQAAGYVLSKEMNTKSNELKPEKVSGDIKKAILFPYNKEMHSVVKFDNLLPFSLYGVYDTVKTGNVGRKIKTYDGNREYLIQDMKNISWDETFDTVILGHLEEYNDVTGQDWMKKMLTFCEKYNKKVYCFDEAPDALKDFSTVQADWPNKSYIPNKFGKLYDICCPVLGVFGTGARQGKYTLQLILREMFLEQGYTLGQIGSEPSSPLFGMDDVFHFGYNKYFQMDSQLFIEALNDSLNTIQEKGVDIILAGCQSGTIPYGFTNVRYTTCKQIDFLTGINPDKVVLCVNIFDDTDYIKRTISFIESLGSCDVIATVLFTMTFAGEYSMVGTPSKKESAENIALKKYEIEGSCSKPCFESGNKEQMQELFKLIVENFS